MGKVIRVKNWGDAHPDQDFAAAIRRLPPPLPVVSNGAACPWCGALHERMTIGWNDCEHCPRAFMIGHPPEGDPDFILMTFVPFPWQAFHELGGRAGLLDDWTPNADLREIYNQIDTMRAAWRPAGDDPER